MVINSIFEPRQSSTSIKSRDHGIVYMLCDGWVYSSEGQIRLRG